MVIISIDLKSFYASAEAVDRQHDPLTTNLVVADASRTEKTTMLSRVNLRPYFHDYPGVIESVSAGGESDSDARPCDFAWVLDRGCLRADCHIWSNIPSCLEKIRKNIFFSGCLHLFGTRVWSGSV